MAFFNLFDHLNLWTVPVAVVGILALRWFLSKPKNLPPGPSGLPFIGALATVVRGVRSGVQPQELFMKYAAKYGPVFHLKILNKDVVVLNDYASIKEAFQHPQLNDRPHMLLTEIYKSEGVVTLSGEPWQEVRRFCLTVLRSFGVGKSSFEEQIGSEADELIREFSASDGKPFNPKRVLGNAVSNVICAVVFGKRYEYDDQDFKQLLSNLEENFRLFGSGGALLYFPSLSRFPFLPIIKNLVSNYLETKAFLQRIINNHRASFDADSVKDFIDVYLKELKSNTAKGEGEGRPSEITEGRFLGTVSNLFGAGTETTATTLQWCLLYMAVYPDVQRRVQDEIDAVVGRNWLPRMADKPELNLTRAVIWEVQRIAVVTPMALPHAAGADATVGGYRVPRGTIVLANFWAVFRDPKLWPEPEAFRPERFLDGEGRAVKREELIPFSTGRRTCIGEHLAKMELLLFFTHFLHQFTFQKPDGAPPYTLDALVGLTHYPAPFEICAVPRD